MKNAQMQNRNSIFWLRWIGFLERTSFLLLLLVAMPLKYVAGQPVAVRVAGSVHGGLFILYLACVAWAARSCSWTSDRVLESVAASLYPLGTFFQDRKLREDLLDTVSNSPACSTERASDTGGCMQESDAWNS